VVERKCSSQQSNPDQWFSREALELRNKPGHCQQLVPRFSWQFWEGHLTFLCLKRCFCLRKTIFTYRGINTKGFQNEFEVRIVSVSVAWQITLLRALKDNYLLLLTVSEKKENCAISLPRLGTGMPSLLPYSICLIETQSQPTSQWELL
jgi:hypothetical protein